MKYYKFLSKTLLLLVFVLSLNITSSIVAAQELIASESIEESVMIEGEKTINPRGEVTGYKYTYFNGVKYKRLWSYTGGYWIDPYWIRCEDQD